MMLNNDVSNIETSDNYSFINSNFPTSILDILI